MMIWTAPSKPLAKATFRTPDTAAAARQRPGYPPDYIRARLLIIYHYPDNTIQALCKVCRPRLPASGSCWTHYCNPPPPPYHPAAGPPALRAPLRSPESDVAGRLRVSPAAVVEGEHVRVLASRRVAAEGALQEAVEGVPARLHHVDVDEPGAGSRVRARARERASESERGSEREREREREREPRREREGGREGGRVSEGERERERD